ncbi:hypothetical protein NDU88_004643 [Pleurodeles waltl]|uniref:Uncharacterized protein n=1 Tax=Pleurodeles waltl TaxID=8319 RepID=A0AAV7UJU8_PLEWA|nr:hypothetical protein NDU88_004643 [Pleurodeles waltl]
MAVPVRTDQEIEVNQPERENSSREADHDDEHPRTGSLECHDMLESFQAIMADVGVPLAPEKTVGPLSKCHF